MEKPIECMSTTELKDALAEYARQSQTPAPGPRLPAGAPPNLTPAQAEMLADNWVENILTRKPETWTPQEREAVREATQRTLRSMGR